MYLQELQCSEIYEISVRDFHSGIEEKKYISINFLQDAGSALLFKSILIYQNMGTAFFERDSHRLFIPKWFETIHKLSQ